MIIEIKDDGHGAWNLTAKTAPDAWPPMHMAYGRSAWAIKALVHGILTENAEAPETAPESTESAQTDPARGSGCTEGSQTISAPPEIIHWISDGSATTSCCWRTPFELPRAAGHRLTADITKANCTGFKERA